MLADAGAPRFDTVRQTMQHFAAGLRKSDRMAILAVAEIPRLVRDFTSSTLLLSDAIAALTPSGPQGNAQAAIAKALELGQRKDEDLPQRRVVVAFLGDKAGNATASTDIEFLPVTDPQEGSYEQIRSFLMEAPLARIACAPCTGTGKPERWTIAVDANGRTLTAEAEITLPLPQRKGNENRQSYVIWWLLPTAGAAAALLTLFARRNRRRTGMPPPLPAFALEERPSTPGVVEPLPEIGLSIQLVTLRGVKRGATYSMRLTSEITVGTSAGCDRVLPIESGLAAKQFALSYVNQRIVLRDLAGDASTTVNGVPIRSDHPLSDGDIIGAGGSEFRLLLGKRE